MRRRTGGNETDLLKIRQLEHFLGEPQMPIMYRVERAAQDTDCLVIGHKSQSQTAGISQYLRKVNGKTRSSRTIDHAMVI